MDIRCIFAERLFAIVKNNKKDIYTQKLDDWQDFEHIYTKAKENSIEEKDIDQFFNEIFSDRESFRQIIKCGCESNTLYEIFESLQNYKQRITRFEESKMKVFIKSENRLSKLRLYALRIKNSSFIITGGAIKFTLRMEKHKDTTEELIVLDQCRDFLISKQFLEEDIIDNYLES
ncbi:MULTISPECIES: hypothetical protein [Myroides]|uniref:Uncharacterized protein n=1 Tax=Myroides phaeus TaxID=702745 RepID=A0A1G8FII1_9FLAO|nr:MULTISPECIES: hypothetical protein [Myroides]MDM1456751.1 hypothetical protein [Myroides odoratimimus]MDM1518115.1 hypothetical protein [Myroides odoratimimus]SDH81921.1 hypothetical protein SAMN05421818_1176 [Myroides phaeus]